MDKFFSNVSNVYFLVYSILHFTESEFKSALLLYSFITISEIAVGLLICTKYPVSPFVTISGIPPIVVEIGTKPNWNASSNTKGNASFFDGKINISF